MHVSYYMTILMEVHLDLRISHFINYSITLASLVAQMVKNLPAMQETWARSLGWEDPMEKDEVTYSSILGLPWWLRC